MTKFEEVSCKVLGFILFLLITIIGYIEAKEKNQPLFYIYDDGTVEKRIVIE